jgi:hypothetical protein
MIVIIMIMIVIIMMMIIKVIPNGVVTSLTYKG